MVIWVDLWNYSSWTWTSSSWSSNQCYLSDTTANMCAWTFVVALVTFVLAICIIAAQVPCKTSGCGQQQPGVTSPASAASAAHLSITPDFLLLRPGSAAALNWLQYWRERLNVIVPRCLAALTMLGTWITLAVMLTSKSAARLECASLPQCLLV